MNSERTLEEILEKDITDGESQSVEFKERFPDSARDLAAEIAAFATSNPGRIYLGVDDDGNIVGLSEIESIQDIRGKDQLHQRIGLTRSSIDPPIRTRVEFLEQNGRIVALIFVPKGSEPVYRARAAYCQAGIKIRLFDCEV